MKNFITGFLVGAISMAAAIAVGMQYLAATWGH
jgi:hypothetical protein